MNKSPIKKETLITKKKSIDDSNNMENYFISLILKFISAFILIIIIFLQLEFLLLFIIQIITNNIYFIIILIIITHLIFIRFLVQSILYVLHCPFLDSFCFHSVSCNRINFLFSSLLNFISCYYKLKKKNKIIEQKDKKIIDDTAHIINAYINFFKILKNGGELSQNQNNIYIKLGIWMKTFDKYKNYLESTNTEDEKEILDENKNQYLMSFLKKMSTDSVYISKILNDYICENQEPFSFKKLYNCFFNNNFFSLEQFSILFHKRFNNTYNYFITSDNQVIDYTIISYEKLDEKYKYKSKSNLNLNNKNLLIFCNPNGMIYQFFIPEKFISFLEGGCDILLWNYRGYGGSSGNPTFKNAKTDILELFDFVKKKYINYNKYGVYGYSVGGGSAVYLANKRKLDVLICDRNFSNVSEIVRDIPYIGIFLYYLVNILNFKYDYNVDEFINSKNKKICKIILCDPKDEIIPNNASLKSGISKYIIKQYCEENKIKKKENILELFLETKDNLKNKFIEALININSLLIKFDENPFQDIINIKKPEKMNIKEKGNNLNDFLLLNISNNYNSDKKYFKNILIKTIIKLFNSFKYSAENLEDFNKKNETRLKLLYINDYFNNYFVWGTISDEKLNEANGFTNPFIINNNNSYLYNAINAINIFLKEKTVQNLEKIEDYKKIFENFNVIKRSLEILRDKSDIFKLEQKINKGNLIRLNCGHNGNISEYDNQNLMDILKEVKFIY